MTFEDSVLRGIDKARAAERRAQREAAESPIEQAHTRAKKVLNNRDYAIQAPDFFDLYTKESVMKDMMRVKKKQRSFEATSTKESNEAKRASEVFEAIVLEH